MSLFDQLSSNLDNFGAVPNAGVQLGGAGMGMTPQQGNPTFVSQIDLMVETVASQIYIDVREFYGAQVSGGATTQSFIQTFVSVLGLPNVDPTIFGSSIPLTLFGNSDWAAGFSKSNALNPINLGKFIGGFVINQNAFAYTTDVPTLVPQYTTKGTAATFLSQAVKEGKAKLGDMVFLYAGAPVEVAPSAGVYHVNLCEVVVSCPQVAYSTLLDSISSDTFVVDGIRYTVPDVTKIDQFTNSIGQVRQSMFGKLTSDSMNPNSMNMPFNNQTNIIDVPLTFGVDKNLMLHTRINAGCRKFIWSLFIKTVNKIKA